MQATYLLPEKPELRMGLGRKLVELDSALVPISSTLVCGAWHTSKPFLLTHTTMRLLLEQQHMQSGGSSLMWQNVGLGTKHKMVGPFFRTGSSREKKNMGIIHLGRFLMCCPMDWFKSTSHICRRM